MLALLVSFSQPKICDVLLNLASKLTRLINMNSLIWINSTYKVYVMIHRVERLNVRICADLGR